MFLYRDHRGLLADSMKTAREFQSKSALISELQNSLNKYGRGEHDCKRITIKPYGFDKRTGWDTHIVCLEDYGVLGFTDSPVPQLEEIKHG